MLRYVENGQVAPDDALIERIDQKVRAINRDGEWVDMAFKYLTIEEYAQWVGRMAGEREGRAAGFEEGLAEGEVKGEARGEAKGEAKLSRLIKALGNAGRMDDIMRAADDAEYREELFKEFAIA